MDTYRYDFIVIGSGIAGLSAAKKLANYGKVALISKGGPHESSTYLAQGGIAAAIDPSDAPLYHLEDTLAAGDGLCDKACVRILVEEGIDHVQSLIKMGAAFDKTLGQFSLTMEGAHRHRRILHAGDATGREIERTLGRSLLQESNISFIPHTVVLKLIVESGRCMGCMVIQQGVVRTFLARGTLLATGGACQIYERNTNPLLSTGDGIAMAIDAGCCVKDMEFIQFHPTTLYTGDNKPISLFLISEAVRGEGAVLRNIFGERFMPDVHDRAELAPRDIVARAIFSEMKNTNAPYVYLDLSAISINIANRFPTITQRCLKANLDITKSFIPVSPAAHYFIGGVSINEWGQTNIQSLYAAGEVSASGVHGANRLASNSLLEGLVFGNRAATKMSEELPLTNKVKPEIISIKQSIHGVKVRTLKQSIKYWMWTYAGIVRCEQGLKDLEKRLLSQSWIQEENLYSEEVLTVKNLWRISLLTTQFALARKESRGAHFRSDFPEKNSSWERHQTK